MKKYIVRVEVGTVLMVELFADGEQEAEDAARQEAEKSVANWMSECEYEGAVDLCSYGMTVTDCEEED